MARNLHDNALHRSSPTRTRGAREWSRMISEIEFEELRAVAFPHAGAGPKITIVAFENDCREARLPPRDDRRASTSDSPGGEPERSPCRSLSRRRAT